jgi:hypothetical protein
LTKLISEDRKLPIMTQPKTYEKTRKMLSGQLFAHSVFDVSGSVLFLISAFRFPYVLFPSMVAICARSYVAEFLCRKQKLIVRGDRPKSFCRNTSHSGRQCALPLYDSIGSRRSRGYGFVRQRLVERLGRTYFKIQSQIVDQSCIEVYCARLYPSATLCHGSRHFRPLLRPWHHLDV